MTGEYNFKACMTQVFDKKKNSKHNRHTKRRGKQMWMRKGKQKQQPKTSQDLS